MSCIKNSKNRSETNRNGNQQTGRETDPEQMSSWQTEMGRFLSARTEVAQRSAYQTGVALAVSVQLEVKILKTEVRFFLSYP